VFFFILFPRNERLNLQWCRLQRPLDATLKTTQGAEVFWTVLNPAVKEMVHAIAFGEDFVLLWYETLI